MNGHSIFLYIAVMAGVTYLMRMLPFTLFRRKITSRFLQDLLYYIPYAVLSAMAIPASFYRRCRCDDRHCVLLLWSEPAHGIGSRCSRCLSDGAAAGDTITKPHELSPRGQLPHFLSHFVQSRKFPKNLSKTY